MTYYIPPLGESFVDSLSPIIPTSNRSSNTTFIIVNGSPKKSISAITVPAAPIPTNTA